MVDIFTEELNTSSEGDAPQSTEELSELYVGADTSTIEPQDPEVITLPETVVFPPSSQDEDVVAQATPKEEQPRTETDIARDIHRSLISNKSWRTENPRSLDWGTFQKHIDNGDVPAGVVISELAQQHNKGVKVEELFHNLYWSTPKNTYETSGVSRRRAATLETLYQIAENSGVPLSYVDGKLDQGFSADALISEFTGAEDVTDMFDMLARAGKDAGRLLVEGGPGALAAMKAAGATFKATTPLRTTPWGAVASVGLSGAAGLGTYLLGHSFMTTDLFGSFDAPSEMLLGKKPEVTPRAISSRKAGETAAMMALFTRPTSATLAKIPKTLGTAKVLTNLDRMNMTAWERTKSYLFPGWKRTGQNLAQAMGEHARKRWQIPFTGGKKTAAGVPMNISDLIMGSGMAGGAFIAEEIDPGDLMTRFSWEMGMGVVNPVRVVGKLLKAGGPAAWSASKGLGRSMLGRAPNEGEAQKGYNWLIDYAEQLGYSEEQILKAVDENRLYDSSGKEIPLTLSQITGMPPLMFLARSLKGEKISPAVRKRLSDLGIEGAMGGPPLEDVIRQGHDAGLRALVEFMDILRREGTSDGLQKAAGIEQALIEDVFQTAIESRINRASEAARRLGPRPGAPSVTDSGEKIYEVLIASLKDARALEKKMYDRAGDALQRDVEATNLTDSWGTLTADPYETGTGIIPEFLAQYKGTGPIIRWLRRKQEKPASEELPDLSDSLRLAERAVKKESNAIDTLDRTLARLQNSPPEVKRAVEDAVFALSRTRSKGFEKGDFELTVKSIDKAFDGTAAGGRAYVAGQPMSNPARRNYEDLIEILAEAQGDFLTPLDIGVSAGSYLGAAQRKMAARLAGSLKDRLVANSQLTSARQKVASLKNAQGVEIAEAAEPGPLITNVGELNVFRGHMLEYAREASAAGKFQEARLYSELAASALDDIGIRTDVVGPLEDAGLEALRRAQTYSRSLNDFFSRMFAADVLKKSPAGGPRTSPELLAGELFTSRSDPTAMKTRQLFEAATFAGESGEEAAKIRGQTLAGAYDTILRDYSTKVLKPILKEDGVQRIGPDGEGLFAVDPEARRKFLKTYGTILEMEGLEDLAHLLRDDVGGITIPAIKALTNRNGSFYKGLEDQAQYARFYNATARGQTGVIDDTSPSIAIAEAFASPNPEQALGRLAKQVEEGAIRIEGTIQTLDNAAHQSVKDGFRQAVFDVAFSKATKADGSVDMNLLADFLVKPLAKSSRTYGGKSSALSILRNAGIVDRPYMQRFQSLIRQWRGLEDTARKGGQLESAMLEGPSAVQELGLSLLGSSVGSEVASTVGKGTLIFQARAASFARDIIGKTPKLMVKRMVTDLLADPELVRIMSRKGKLPPSHVNRISEFFSNYIGTPMSPTLIEQYRKDYERDRLRGMIEDARESGATPDQLQQMFPRSEDVLRYVPPRPNVPPIPPVVQAKPSSPPPVQLSSAPPSAGSLTYDQVFPNDPIAPLVEGRRDRQQRQQLAATQGIGSLA